MVVDKTLKTKRGGQKLSYVDRFLEILPEIHIMGYNYCGPNTNLEKRLACGDPGINELDCACKQHDIAYTESTNLEWRCNADKILILKAIKRIYAKDSRFGERIVALVVSGLISIKMILAKIEIHIKRIQIVCTIKSKRNENNKNRVKKKKK